LRWLDPGDSLMALAWRGALVGAVALVMLIIAAKVALPQPDYANDDKALPSVEAMRKH